MNNCRITIPAAVLDQALVRLCSGASDISLGGALTDAASQEFIACEHPPPREVRAVLLLADRFRHPKILRAAEGADVVLEIGRESRLGRGRGWMRTGEGEWEHARELFLPGPLMTHAVLSPAIPVQTRPAIEGERWSRTRGALGARAHDRLRTLRVGIAGLGRLGCVLARMFAGCGVAALVMADPDHVEMHNTGEGGFFDEGDIGQFKVHTWENWLAVHHPEIEATACAASVSQAMVQRAFATCDLIVSAADHPSARLLAAATASAFARPLLDVGTRVLVAGDSPGREPTAGLDVRYIFPGRCLLCFGGVGPGAEATRRIIESPDFEREFQGQRDGLAERLGSLDSLNQLAAAYAMRMVEDGLAGRLAGHTWRREEFFLDGHSRAAYLNPLRDMAPCFCRVGGWGMAAAPQVIPILDGRTGRALT